MNRKLTLRILTGILFCGIMGTVFFSTTQVFSAAGTTGPTGNPILDKAMLQGIQKCYTKNYMVPYLRNNNKDIISLSEWKRLNPGREWLADQFGMDSPSSFITLPNGMTQDADSSVDCRDLIYHETNGILKLSSNKPTGLGAGFTDSFLKGMGYGAFGGVDGKCIYYSFIKRAVDLAGATDLEVNTPSICVEGITSDNSDVSADSIKIEGTSADNQIIISVADHDSDNEDEIRLCIGSLGQQCSAPVEIEGNWTDLKRNIEASIRSMEGSSISQDSLVIRTDSGGRLYDYIQQGNTYSQIDMRGLTTNYGFIEGSAAEAAVAAVNYLSNNSVRSFDTELTAGERIAMLQYYVLDYYNSQKFCPVSPTEEEIARWVGTGGHAGDGYYRVKLSVGSSFAPQDCFAKPGAGQSLKKVFITNNEGKFGPALQATYEEVIEMLNNANWNSLSSENNSLFINSGANLEDPPATPSEAESEAGAPSDPSSEETKTCYDGAGALGWILCPVIEGAGTALNDIYDDVITPFARIDARLFQEGEDGTNPTFEAWSTFQGFANIAFVIFLLVVIFSQLTGVGIDNYGIKKILPKLIIAAVLINLSYIICQLAVDISNIAGYGIKALFDSIGNGINVGGSYVAEAVGSDPSLVGAVPNIVTVLLAGLGVAAIISQGLAIVLPLLLAIVSAFISVIFIFVLLGVRQAGVVILIVLAPLAVVSYMLPNTKTIFDRWRKMFVGLLIFFPICGLLMGGGALASKIILSTNPDVLTDESTGFWTGIIGLLINVVPFFFLPMILRSSFAAMGNIGAKISGVGKGVNKWAGGLAKPALEKSRFGQWAGRGKANREYQRTERNKYAQEQYQYRKAQGRLKDYTARMESGENLSERDMRKAATAARTVAGGDKQAIDDAKIMIMKATKNGADEAAVQKTFYQAVGNNDTTRARAAAEIMGGQKFQAIDFDKWMKDDQFSDTLNNIKDAGQRRSMVEGIAKTMTTGDGSKNYRAANAFQFQHATDLLQNSDTPDEFSTDWLNRDSTREIKDAQGRVTGHYSNADVALGNHITNANELFGQGSDFLKTLTSGDLDAHLSQATKDRIKTLASRALDAYRTGQIEGDSTKENYIKILAGEAPRPPISSSNAAPNQPFNVNNPPQPSPQNNNP